MRSIPRQPEAKKDAEKPALYIAADGQMAYWKDNEVHILTPEQLAERTRREANPTTPPEGDLPELGGVRVIDSLDEVEGIEKTNEGPEAHSPSVPASAAPEHGEAVHPDAVPPETGFDEMPLTPPTPAVDSTLETPLVTPETSHSAEPAEENLPQSEAAETPMQTLSRDGFTMVFVPGAWTGHDEGDGMRHYYTHRDAPGRRFTEEEYLRIAQGNAPTGEQNANQNERAQVDPSLITTERRERPGRQNGSWEIIDKEYIGLTIKPVREILANERDAQFFGETLRSLDHPNVDGVLERYNKHTPTKEDMSFMSYAAHEYARSLKLAEDVNASITKEELELFSRRQKDTFNLIHNEGEDRTIEIVKNSILHTAMRRPADLEDMRDALKHLKEDRETIRFKRFDARIDELCKRAGIERKDFTAVYDVHTESDRAATQTRLRDNIHEQAGTFRRALDWTERWTAIARSSNLVLPGSSRDLAIRSMMQAEGVTPEIGPTAWVLDRIDKNINTIANTLGNTISNPETRSLVAQEVLSNQNTILAKEAGPVSFSQVKRLEQGAASVNSFKARIEQRFPNIASRPQAEQDTMLGQMRAEEMRRHTGQGFWAKIFAFVFGSNFNKAASSVVGRPVHA